MSNGSMSKHPKTVWVVGASTGIGLSLAETFLQEGHRVIMSGRRFTALETEKEKLLQSHANADVMIEPMDITDEGAVTEACLNIDAAVADGVDTVIINAGICEYIDSVRIDLDSVRRVMETNFFGALSVVNGVLPLLRKTLSNGRQPQLVFVSSSVAYQALPRAGAYGSSKAALSYFAESLKLDLQNEGIDVRTVSPGFVQTPLTDQNDFAMPARITSEDAANRIVKGLSKNGFDIHFPKRFTLVLKFISILPNKLKHALLGKMSRHNEELEAIKENN